MAYLVTGAQGCIGTWVVKNLVDRGDAVVVLDVDAQPRRLRQVLSEQEISRVQFVEGDICHYEALEALFVPRQITRVIHLAALQVPACQANPRRGALVNVLGTINLFEAVARHKEQVNNIVYASSAAVAGPEDEYQGAFSERSQLKPATHYGVFKQANEGNAAVYAKTEGIASIGLRPWAVYGVGRDFGLTSDPTKAIKAAVAQRPFEIQFGGRIDMQLADDVAKIFIACADASLKGARIYNLRGDVLAVADLVRIIEEVVPAAKGLIRHRENHLPIVPEFDDSAIRADLGSLPQTSFAEGVRQTVAIFRRLQQEGRLSLDELGA